MHPSLTTAFQRLERQREEFLSPLRDLPVGKLEARPGPGQWSLLDVVQHLVLVDEGVTAYGEKKVNAPGRPMTLTERLRLRLLSAAFRMPVRVKAPTPVVIPKETVPLGELEARWAAARSRMAALFDSLPEEKARAAFFRHAIVGMLDPAGLLAFLECHVAHHRRQVGRIRASDAFRKA